MGAKNRVKKLEGGLGDDWQEYERRSINLWGAFNERLGAPYDPEAIKQRVRELRKEIKTPADIQLSPLGEKILKEHGIEVD